MEDTIVLSFPRIIQRQFRTILLVKKFHFSKRGALYRILSSNFCNCISALLNLGSSVCNTASIKTKEQLSLYTQRSSLSWARSIRPLIIMERLLYHKPRAPTAARIPSAGPPTQHRDERSPAELILIHGEKISWMGFWLQGVPKLLFDMIKKYAIKT